MCTILNKRLCRILAFNSPDIRIANAAKEKLENDIAFNSNFSTEEVREIVKGLNENSSDNNKKKYKKKRDKKE